MRTLFIVFRQDLQRPTPLKINGWNMSSWRFGWDHFPFKNGWFVGEPAVKSSRVYCLKYQDTSIPCKSNAQTSDTLVCERIDGDRLALTTPKSYVTVSKEAFYQINQDYINGSGRGDRLCLLSKVGCHFSLHFFGCVKVGLPLPWVNPAGKPMDFTRRLFLKRENLHHVAAHPCMRRGAVTGTQAGSCCVWWYMAMKFDKKVCLPYNPVYTLLRWLIFFTLVLYLQIRYAFWMWLGPLNGYCRWLDVSNPYSRLS